MAEQADARDLKSRAGDSVRVLPPSPAPRRRGLHIVCGDVFFFKANVISRSFLRFPFPNRTRSAGLRFGFATGLKTTASILLESYKRSNPNPFPIGDGFGFFVSFGRYQITCFHNGVKRKPAFLICNPCAPRSGLASSACMKISIRRRVGSFKSLPRHAQDSRWIPDPIYALRAPSFRPGSA